MKVLICGGRDWDDVERTLAYLDQVHADRPITTVVHGDARGADSLGDFWAHLNKIESRAYPADWETHGRRAGSIRNRKMLDVEQPDLVLAFPGGRGTAHMVSIARGTGVPVEEPFQNPA